MRFVLAGTRPRRPNDSFAGLSRRSTKVCGQARRQPRARLAGKSRDGALTFSLLLVACCACGGLKRRDQ